MSPPSFAMQRVARGVMREGLFVAGSVLERLADGELEMHSVFVGQVGSPEPLAQGEHVGIAEAESLEIRETPPGLA